ncbi:MAG: hypothetical protein RLZZ232_3261 [Planctomycetota bacterium]
MADRLALVANLASLGIQAFREMQTRPTDSINTPRTVLSQRIGQADWCS